MTELAPSTATSVPRASLATRLIGVLLSPRDAYTVIAARPRAFGALLVSIAIMIGASSVFLSTEVGRDAMIARQIDTLKTFANGQVSDEQVQALQRQAPYAAYIQGAAIVVFIPILAAAIAGLLLAIFTAILGGGATFKQVYAVAAHSMIIGAVQQAFSFPIMYAKGEMVSPTQLAVFFPMLPEQGFATYLLSVIDLFYIWSLINLSIGVAVLYKRKTGSVAAVLLGIYAVVAVIIATVRAF